MFDDVCVTIDLPLLMLFHPLRYHICIVREVYKNGTARGAIFNHLR